jgi:hypothetical protein
MKAYWGNGGKRQAFMNPALELNGQLDAPADLLRGMYFNLEVKTCISVFYQTFYMT